MDAAPPAGFVYLAHCLLNQNAKVDEYAKCAGAYSPLVERLRARGYRMRQMPCPELGFSGANRFWAVREQYDTPGYRAHCSRLAVPVVEQIEHDLRTGAPVVLIGLDGSPTMGVRLTCSGPDWGGRPDKDDERDSDIVPGTGVFTATLLAALAERGIPLRATGLNQDDPDYDEQVELEALDAFLDAEAP